MPVPDSTPLSPKAEATRRSIIDSAMRLFEANGYDGTTMRAIARDAGVSQGNAYYYFSSKEHLVQAFYDRMHDAHLAAVKDVLSRETSFTRRLGGVLSAWVEVAEPYHGFAGTFFKNAAEPTSPLSPFSGESRPAREATIDIFRQVVEGSDLKIAAGLRQEMPELLWLAQMGVVLFWVHDSSAGQRRTRALIRTATPLVDKLARMTRMPFARGVADDVVALIRSLR